ncbi:hypothetical protein JHK85_048411 [Glycine max]|nr:hypothetical protein JHK85_048411 [Glycine max]
MVDSMTVKNCPWISFSGYELRLAHLSRAMASHIVGYPHIGPKRELKSALESFWDGKSNVDDL